MMQSSSQPRTQLLSHWAWIAALLAHFLLAGGIWFWAGLLSGLLLILPLAAALPGLLKRSSYTAGWLTMLMVFYVAGLMAEAFSIPSRRAVALGLSILAMFEFIALVLFVRLLGRERAAVPMTVPGGE